MDLESVSDGLSENWDEMPRKTRKFKGFFLPKLGDLQKKKRSSPKFRVIFRPKSEIQRFFPPKIRWSPKKKKVFAKIQSDFSSNFANSDVWGGALFVWGGLFSIFHRKSASKAQKRAILHTSQANGGARAPPPPPPWLRYWSGGESPLEWQFCRFQNFLKKMDRWDLEAIWEN